ncbi:MAG: hypothetical protein GY920_12110 [Aliivibrio sp.]|nr:hypothetical protein [Aliivibrio sp.]
MKPFTSKHCTPINYGSPLENKGKIKPTSKLEEASDRQLLNTPGEEAKALLRERARKRKNKEQK